MLGADSLIGESLGLQTLSLADEHGAHLTELVDDVLGHDDLVQCVTDNDQLFLGQLWLYVDEHYLAIVQTVECHFSS